MTDFHDDFEARLRASLANRARGAPDAGPVADHVLAEVEQVVSFGAPEPQHPRWRSWGLPLVAAAAVAAIVGGVVGVSHLHTDADPVGTLRHSTTAPSPTVSTPPKPVSSTPSVPVKSTSTGTAYTPIHFQVRDLTFVGANEGWAMGTADCLNGSGQACTALAYTSDGTHWIGRGSSPFNVPGVASCADPCVTNIRFATPTIGYVFGPTALFLTTDGAATWHRLAGGAAALETLNNNVIRVSAVPAGCVAPGCTYAVQTAGIASTSWQATSLTSATTAGMTTGVQLSRSAGVAVLAVLGHPAGGASSAVSTVYTSTDNGANWTNRGEPCATVDTPTENDTVAVTAAPDDSLTVMCAARGGQQAFSVASTDRGSSWQSGGTLQGPTPTAVVAASAQNLLELSGDASVGSSTDGGTSWQAVPLGGGFPTIVWIGYESSSIGRIVTIEGNRTTVWTSTNGGVWTPNLLN